MSKKSTAPAGCPCGGPSLASCCGPYIAGTATAPSAEALMRSRYTAYVQRNQPYLLATWHASTRPTEPIMSDDEKLQWLGLEVKSALRLRQRKADEANRDTVEFVARFKLNGQAQRLHEISNFVREPAEGGDPRWFYVDGSFPE